MLKDRMVTIAPIGVNKWVIRMEKNVMKSKKYFLIFSKKRRNRKTVKKIRTIACGP
jgi:hypothetical protein